MAQDLPGYLDLVKRTRPDDLLVVTRELDPAYEITALVVKLERQARPVVLRVGGEQRDLARAGGRRLAVEGHAGRIRAAVGELPDHRADVGAEPLGDRVRLAEETDDSAHGADSTVRLAHVPWAIRRNSGRAYV